MLGVRRFPVERFESAGPDEKFYRGRLNPSSFMHIDLCLIPFCKPMNCQ